MVVAGQAVHPDALVQRRVDERPVRLEVLDDLRADHEAVRVGAAEPAPLVVPAVGEVRELALPVRRDQAERLPPVGLPGVADLVALEHEVVDPRLLQAAAHREAGLPATHDDHGPVHPVQVAVPFPVPRRGVTDAVVMTGRSSQPDVDVDARPRFRGSASGPPISEWLPSDCRRRCRMFRNMPRHEWLIRSRARSHVETLATSTRCLASAPRGRVRDVPVLDRIHADARGTSCLVSGRRCDRKWREGPGASPGPPAPMPLPRHPRTHPPPPRQIRRRTA